MHLSRLSTSSGVDKPNAHFKKWYCTKQAVNIYCERRWLCTMVRKYWKWYNHHFMNVREIRDKTSDWGLVVRGAVGIFYSSFSNSNISQIPTPAFKNSSSVIFPSLFRSHCENIVLTLLSSSASLKDFPCRSCSALVSLERTFAKLKSCRSRVFFFQ